MNNLEVVHSLRVTWMRFGALLFVHLREETFSREDESL